jgi:hypothetical protein
MVMQEQAQRLSQPLHWGKREKTALGVALACLVLSLAALGAYALTKGSPARADCIRVTFASTLGGADLHGCGGRARSICASGSFAHIGHDLQAACQKAGFPYRQPG